MTTKPQSITYHQPGWYVENVYQTVNNYHLPPEQQPLWIDVPSLPAHFIGRDAIVADLSARLTAGGSRSVSVSLSAEGKPGVGKTTLAVALAHHREVLAHFSDGVLWAGLGPQPDLPSRLARWADALGVDVSDRPTVEARAQAVRDAIGHKRLLLVIDDAWQLEAAEHLRCGGPNCAHLLTSRDQGLAFAFAGRSERVEELTPADALELLRRLAPKAVAVDEAQSAGLLAAVGYLPLAVELLGGYLAAGASARFADASRSALADLTDPARRLALASRRLGDGTGKPVSLQETIALSIDGLAEESPAAVDVFYSLGAFASKPASFDRAAAQAVAECDADALVLLIDRNLLEYNDADEFMALHQTIADMTLNRIPAEAVTRHREHYLERVNADREGWQAIEVLYAQIQYAWQQTPPTNRVIVEFVDALGIYQSRRGFWADRLAWLNLAVSATEKNADSSGQARMLNEFGTVCNALGENREALGYYEQALRLFRKVEDRSAESTTLNNIGSVYNSLGEMEKALGYYGEALSLTRQVGDRGVEATTLNNIGRVYQDLGEKEKALGYFSEALPLFRQAGDRNGEATTLHNFGGVYSELGEKEKALGYFSEALPLRRQVGDRGGEATTLNCIGLVYHYSGEMERALGYYEEVLPLFRQVGDRSMEATTLNNIGGVYSDLGEKEKALGYFSEALPLRRQVGNPRGAASTLTNIGDVYSALGEKEKALGYYEEALPLLRQVRNWGREATTLNNIGRVYQDLGEKGKALRYFLEALPLRRQVGDQGGEAVTLNNIGGVYSDLGEKEKARQSFEQALVLWIHVGDRSGEIVTRWWLANLHHSEGNRAAAIAELEKGLSIAREVRSPHAAPIDRQLTQLRSTQ